MRDIQWITQCVSISQCVRIGCGSDVCKPDTRSTDTSGHAGRWYPNRVPICFCPRNPNALDSRRGIVSNSAKIMLDTRTSGTIGCLYRGTEPAKNLRGMHHESREPWIE